MNSFKNNEKTEFIKEGSSEYPPILKFSTDKSPLLQENLPEDIIEKVFLQEILSIYKKNAPNTPIKIPIIEIEVEKKTSNEENFSNIYNKIIDKNNPYASPKLMKRKASPITPMRTFQSKTNSDGFSKNDTIKSPLRKINIAMDPFKLLEVITSKEVSIIKTTQNFNKKSCSPKHTIGKESPSMKIDYKNDLLNSNLNKYNKKILASNTLTNPLCFNGSNQLYKTNSKNFKKATTNNLINTKTKKYSSQKIIPFYTGKDTNPVYILEDDNENEKIDKLESPLNKLITKLKKTPLENQKNNDIFKEIEGVNTLVEAALTEDSLLLKKNIRKKSKSFGLSIGNPYINTPNDILEFFGTDK